MRVVVSLVVGIWLGFGGQVVATGQQTPVPPSPTATPAHPFFITKTWVIGGVGDGDYLTMDPTTRELFIAHGPMVQVVDVDSGAVAGSVKGFRQAHARGARQPRCLWVRERWPGGRGAGVRQAVVPSGCEHPDGPCTAIDGVGRSKRFAVRNWRTAGQRESGDTGWATWGSGFANDRRRLRATPHGTESSVTVIDTGRRVQLAQLVIPGELGFAQSDGDGRCTPR